MVGKFRDRICSRPVVYRPCVFCGCLSTKAWPYLGHHLAVSRPHLGWLAFDCSWSAAAQQSPLAVSQPYLGSHAVSRPSISATSIWLLSGYLSGPCLFGRYPALSQSRLVGSLSVASRSIVHRYTVWPAVQPFRGHVSQSSLG